MISVFWDFVSIQKLQPICFLSKEGGSIQPSSSSHSPDTISTVSVRTHVCGTEYDMESACFKEEKHHCTGRSSFTQNIDPSQDDAPTPFSIKRQQICSFLFSFRALFLHFSDTMQCHSLLRASVLSLNFLCYTTLSSELLL